MKVDLHTHSSASDGLLSPAELVNRAATWGLTHVALTDHDTTSGLAEAVATAATAGLRLIPGIEISSTWNDLQIHIVGLFIDSQAQPMRELVAAQLTRRRERAEEIGLKLERAGFPHARAETAAQAGPGAIITRGNYARYIASTGCCATPDAAFRAYLKRGKIAYVNTRWISIAEAIEAIRGAGGVAVLAHPKRYTMSNRRLRKLIGEFSAMGGEAMEVANSQQRPSDREYLGLLCRNFELLASVGSDFHAPGLYRELGVRLELPEGLCPVWEHERAAAYGFGPKQV